MSEKAVKIEIKNYTFEKPTGELVSIEAKSEKKAKAAFVAKYKAKQEGGK